MAFDPTLPFAHLAGDPVAHMSFIQDMRAFLREQMAAQSEEEFFEWLNSQDDQDREDALALICEPAFTLNPHQIIPNIAAQSWHVDQQEKVFSFEDWDRQPKKLLFDKQGKPQAWRKIFNRMGRGAGKTHAASCTVHDLARYVYPGLTGILVGPIHKDVMDVMIEGESGLIKTAPADFVPRFSAYYNRVEWPNGSKAIVRTADDPESIRGPSIYWGWGDELAKWKSEKSYKNLNRTIRNKHPAGNRLLLTTSPLSSQKWVRALERNPNTITIVASSFDIQQDLAYRGEDADLQRRAIMDPSFDAQAEREIKEIERQRNADRERINALEVVTLAERQRGMQGIIQSEKEAMLAANERIAAQERQNVVLGQQAQRTEMLTDFLDGMFRNPLQQMRQFFAEFMRQIAAALLKALLLKEALPGGGSVGGLLKSSLLGALGARASGGSINSRRPYVVGEKGPELFFPGRAGEVLSNRNSRRFGGGGSFTNAPTFNITLSGNAQQDRMTLAELKHQQGQSYAEFRVQSRKKGWG